VDIVSLALMLKSYLPKIIFERFPPEHQTKSKTNRTKNMNAQIEKAIRTAGNYPFRHESGHPDYDAERNLQGRTHWADPATRKSFKSRILDASVSHDGLVYWLIESNGSKPYDTKNNKRFVAFDVFGSVLTEHDEWFTTSKAAYKSGKAWLESFDAEAHTKTRLIENARRGIKNSNEVLECFGEA
jgi:hypothetical protein